MSKESFTNKLLYNGLDAKQTFEKSIEQFNQRVKYYKIHSQTTGKTDESHKDILGNEVFKGDFRSEEDLINERLCKLYNEDGKYSGYIINIANGYSSNNYIFGNGRFNQVIGVGYSSMIYSDEDESLERQEECYNDMQRPFFINIYNVKGVDVYDIQRSDENQDIVITLKYKYTIYKEYWDMDKKTNYEEAVSESCQIVKYYIGQSGLVYKDLVEFYSDDKFDKVLSTDITYYSNFNKKKKFNYEKENARFKSFEEQGMHKLAESYGLRFRKHAAY